jgi:tetratricopeptide (TPR) repeat protein
MHNGRGGGGFGVASLAQGDHQRPGKAGGLSWIGGAAVVVIGGLWTGITYFVDHKAEHGEGPSKEQIEQIQKPLAERLAAQNALIKMLLEKNPTAAPGAQQAVGAALQSIAQGAEAGETRLEKALGLLKENKLAEATRLLTAVAGDKEARAERATAQAEKDHKEAATASRNLGAIAGLADPKRALEAYEKAASLDPDDIQSPFWIGWIQIGYGDLLKARTRLERVSKLAETGDHSRFGPAQVTSVAPCTAWIEG